MDAKERANFRSTKVWRALREEKRSNDKVDFLTRKKLSKSYNLHHMDLNPDHYDDLSNSENFIPLNKKSHECIHFLYDYYAKDPTILDRLKDCLDKMVKVNS